MFEVARTKVEERDTFNKTTISKDKLQNNRNREMRAYSGCKKIKRSHPLCVSLNFDATGGTRIHTRRAAFRLPYVPRNPGAEKFGSPRKLGSSATQEHQVPSRD